MMSWKALALAATLATGVLPGGASAQVVKELRFPLGAGGFGFLPLHMMQHHRLVETYAREAGLDVTVNWSSVGGASVMNDALLSGSAHLISAGPPSFLTLWDRTRSNIGVKAIAAISALPSRITARTDALKSLDDISGTQKIGVVGVKVSIPSILMQMYARQKFGKDQTFRFDPFTVNTTHPDAVVALLSGSGAIVAHGSSVPFDHRELKDPKVRTILDSATVLGGAVTFTIMSTTTRFRTENPKLVEAVVKALRRAQEMIAADRRDAASVLLEAMGGKGWTIDEFVEILDDPSTIYENRPQKVMAYARFMNDIGSLRNRPTSLDDLFFDTVDLKDGD